MAVGGKWVNHYSHEVDHLHVMPQGDSLPHCPANTCFCRPSLELIARPDDSIGAVYLHRKMTD